MCRELGRVLKDLKVAILALGVIDEGEPQLIMKVLIFWPPRFLMSFQIGLQISNLNTGPHNRGMEASSTCAQNRVEAQFELMFAVVP
jgi:hypothetical protein